MKKYKLIKYNILKILLIFICIKNGTSLINNFAIFIVFIFKVVRKYLTRKNRKK